MFLHYTYGLGAPLTLSRDDMVSANPDVDITHSPEFNRLVADLRSSGGGRRAVSVKAFGWAGTQGTLNQFTADFRGDLDVYSDGNWFFGGTVQFEDTYDFDPRAADRQTRSTYGEAATRFCALLCMGQGYDVRSEPLRVQQAGPAVVLPDYPQYTYTNVLNFITRHSELMRQLNPIMRRISQE